MNKIFKLLIIFILLYVSTHSEETIPFKIEVENKVKISITDEYLFGNIEDGIPDKDTLIVKYYDNGNKRCEGKFAVPLEGDIDCYEFKTGYFREFYQNGQLKGEGQYKVGSYLDCCNLSACKMYYHYRIDDWIFYDSLGKLIYEVKYIPKKLRLKANLENESLIFGVLNNSNQNQIFDVISGCNDDDIYILRPDSNQEELHFIKR